jgi:hypothetical protein
VQREAGAEVPAFMSPSKLLQGTNMVQGGEQAQLVLVNWVAGFALLVGSGLLAPGAEAPLVAATAAVPAAAAVYNARAQPGPAYYMEQLRNEVQRQVFRQRAPNTVHSGNNCPDIWCRVFSKEAPPPPPPAATRV